MEDYCDMDICFRKFDFKNELKVQRELFKECFPETIDTPKISNMHYLWKFQSKDTKNPSSEFVAYIDNEILGYYAAIPYYYRFKSDTLKVAMVCDVMTGIKARGKGVFTKLGVYSTLKLATEGFDISTGFPIRNAVLPGHLKAGWEKSIKLPLYGRFINSRSFLRNIKLGLMTPFLNLLICLFNNMMSLMFKRQNKLLNTFYTTSDNLDDLNRLSDFYKQWANDIPISLIKDEGFLKWRLGAPKSHYHIITLEENGHIIGILIAREIEKMGVSCMGILDLAILKNYYQYSGMLIKEIINVSKKTRNELLLIMLSKTWYKKYKLIFNGFLKTPYRFYFITKLFSGKISKDDATNEENWHLTWIDSDDL